MKTSGMVVKFGAQIAKRVRAARKKLTDKWHLDEVVFTIRGKKHRLPDAAQSDAFLAEMLGES